MATFERCPPDFPGLSYINHRMQADLPGVDFSGLDAGAMRIYLTSE